MPKLVQLQDTTGDNVYPKTLFHFTEIVSKSDAKSGNCVNGFNSGSYCPHSLRNRYGSGNSMIEFYGGIYIPNIEDYETLIVELNYGGYSVGGQMSGGIVLYQGASGTLDSEYGDGWQNQVLYPPTSNYCKASVSKIISVGDRRGIYVVGSLWRTYSGTDFIWNRGFGSEGSTLRVIGIRK